MNPSQAQWTWEILDRVFAVAGVVLVLLFFFFEDPISNLAVRVFGSWSPLHSRRNIKGLWESEYSLYSNKERRIRVERHLIELRQIRSRVHGRSIGTESHQYVLSGKLYQETYLTAIWESIREHDSYNGACQLILTPRGDELKGKWVGFDSAGEVQHGDWTLRRISRSLKRSTPVGDLHRENAQ